MNAAVGFAAGTVARYGVRTGFRSIMRSARTRVRSGRPAVAGRKRKNGRAGIFSRGSNKRTKRMPVATVRSIATIIDDLNRTHKNTVNLGSFTKDRALNVRNPVDAIIKGDNHWDRTGQVIHIKSIVYSYSFTYTGLFDGGHCILHMMMAIDKRSAGTDSSFPNRMYLPNVNGEVPIAYGTPTGPPFDPTGDDLRERSLFNTKDYKILAHKKVIVAPPEVEQTSYKSMQVGRFIVPFKRPLKMTYSSSANTVPFTGSEMYPRLKFILWITAPNTSKNDIATTCTARVIQHVYFVP